MVKILFEQHFQLMGELYQTLCNHRKELSIPGSVVVQNDVLFDKDSLQLAQQQQKVNRASFGSGCYKSFPLFSQKNHYHSLSVQRQIIWFIKPFWVQKFHTLPESLSESRKR